MIFVGRWNRRNTADRFFSIGICATANKAGAISAIWPGRLGRKRCVTCGPPCAIAAALSRSRHGPKQSRTLPRQSRRRRAAARSLENRARPLEFLLQLFSTSQSFSDLLSLNPDYLDMLRVPLRRSPSAAELLAQLQNEVEAAFEDSAVLRAFRRFRQRQMLRIGTNDIIRDRPLEEITRDIAARRRRCAGSGPGDGAPASGRRFGEPCTATASRSRCVILAFGKHGGEELNYSSDIDLMFLYDEEGRRTASASPASATMNSSAAWSARWCGCCRRTPIAAKLIASICGCVPRGSAARWPGRWPARFRYYDTPGPHLGTAGPHQAAARRRRSGNWANSSCKHRAFCLPQIS